MEKFSNNYKGLLYESLQDKVSNKLSTEYSSLKRGVLDLIEKTIENYNDLINIQNFINDYTENVQSVVLEEFVEDMQIFDFYIKYQVDIDYLCEKLNYFNEPPKNKNINSLYSFVIEGTKFSVIEIMKILEKEIFKK
jgi:hypothetical protein